MIAVVDASVALKWQFEDEEATPAASALLADFVKGEIELITPTLFAYEILSAVNVAVNRGRIGEETGYKAVRYITSLGIDVRSLDELIHPIFQLARRYRLSAYDCAYIALAEKEECDLFTGDKKLFNAASKKLSSLKWIGDYPLNRSGSH